MDTPVARIVDAARNRCNVPSSKFNAITPWQLPIYNHVDNQTYQTETTHQNII